VSPSLADHTRVDGYTSVALQIAFRHHFHYDDDDAQEHRTVENWKLPLRFFTFAGCRVTCHSVFSRAVGVFLKRRRRLTSQLLKHDRCQKRFGDEFPLEDYSSFTFTNADVKNACSNDAQVTGDNSTFISCTNSVRSLLKLKVIGNGDYSTAVITNKTQNILDALLI